MDGSYVVFCSGAWRGIINPSYEETGPPLSQGGLEILGETPAAEEPESKSWIVVFTEREAMMLYRTLRPPACISITDKACHVGTRYKRRRCKGVSSPIKTPKDLEKYVAELAPALV